MTTDVETRIKIYKKEGYDYANQSMGYSVSGSLKEKIQIMDAVTYNLVDGKIEKTKLKSDGEFDEAVNKYYGRRKITMPNVKEGSVIEFRYKVRSPYVSWVRDWKFQYDIPVNHSELTTYFPEYYVFNVMQKGFSPLKVTTEKKSSSIMFTNKERGTNKAGGTTFTTEKVDYQETKTVYVGDNLPAMKDEAYVNNIDNYTTTLSHELSMVKWPNTPIKSYSSDWNSVVKRFMIIRILVMN